MFFSCFSDSSIENLLREDDETESENCKQLLQNCMSNIKSASTTSVIFFFYDQIVAAVTAGDKNDFDNDFAKLHDWLLARVRPVQRCLQFRQLPVGNPAHAPAEVQE